MQFTDLLDAYLDAKREYDLAVQNVPSYTGQYDSEHFYREELTSLRKAQNALDRFFEDLKC